MSAPTRDFKSCAEIKESGFSHQDGTYWIDPDGEGGILPFSVTCKLSQPGSGVTIVTHNADKCLHVKGYEDPGSYRHDVIYEGATIEQLTALTQVSTTCDQYMRYECFGSVIYSNRARLRYAWWQSRDNERQFDWGGAPWNSGECACTKNRSCFTRGEVCNCDSNAELWLSDNGLLNNKTLLPVTQLRFGDTGGKNAREEGYHFLGPLRCYNGIEQTPYQEPSSCTETPSLSNRESGDSTSSPIVISEKQKNQLNVYRSCALLFQSEDLADGEYEIDPDGTGPIRPFVVRCVRQNGTVVAVVHHNADQCQVVTGYEEPGSYDLPISYNGVTTQQLTSLTEYSRTCIQYLRYECFGSIFRSTIYPGLRYAWWEAREGTNQSSWGGVPSNVDGCECSLTDTCKDRNNVCNCDSNRNEWNTDGGLLTDKTCSL
ncbi:PREDICTED: contactin-associated protein-like 2 [Priapulus caudatus]|uniref:Contactin-associated protein-like 2 n=1 Tax=Priapulus caudatus TaxID=37621 RepID=A0ABM1F015_PRICU|nr:PREDICTED: contactin-associated protein-like 2 [Priapulus caudatus]